MALLDDKGLTYFVGKLKDMFAPKNHTHDGRYYTESEIDGKLSGKANSSHTHTKAQVGLGNVDNTADSAKSVKAATKLQTYKQGSTTVTYGDSYPLYAQWSGDDVVLKCDNYTVWTDRASISNSANAVAWGNVSGKPSTYPPSSHTHSYLPLSGGITTGRITAPEVAATSYFVTPTMVGEGDTSTYYHRVDWGKAGNDKVDFYEYGGIWNFYKNTAAGKDSAALVASIQADGVHANLKGKADTAGTAEQAAKLTTNAGSATQPVYFSNGVPVATTYTLGKSVPANAVFTDTNTWRGVQNNLTSDSTDQSLSAAQGKVLKSLVDGKAAANHTHSQYLTAHQDISGKVDKSEAGANILLATLTTTWTATPTDDTYFVRQDTGGGSTFGRVKFSTLWSYIKGKGDATYQPKGSYAASSHTHNYAGASSAGGSANSAVKLDTATAGSATQPVYFTGGKPAACSYTLGKSVPSNAVFTDTTYGVATASSNGLMSNGDKAKLDALGDIVTIQKSLKLTTDWMDTGIAGDNLSSGSYIVQISGLTTNSTGFYGEIFSGIMTWYDGETNSSESDEIPLHSAGHAQNGNKVYLRTSRRNRGNGNLHLQISAKYAGTAADTITFKFRKMI